MSRPVITSLMEQKWPDLDRELWAIASKRRGIRDIRKEARWGHSTRSRRAHSYGIWLQFLLVYYPESLLLQPGARISRDRVKAFVEYLQMSAAGLTVAAYLYRLYSMFKAIDSGGDFLWVYHASKIIADKSVPSPRAPTILSPRLDEVGQTLMDSVLNDFGVAGPFPFYAVERYQDGMMIRAMAHTVIRRGAFSNLRTSHLSYENGMWCIYMPAFLTKTNEEQDYPLSVELSRYLTIYLEKIRPHYRSSNSHDWLWVKHGGPMHPQSIANRFNKRTFAMLGQAVPPHRFRNGAATFLVEHSSGDAMAARDLLGHRDMRMTRVYIDSSETRLVGARIASIIAKKKQAKG